METISFIIIHARRRVVSIIYKNVSNSVNFNHEKRAPKGRPFFVIDPTDTSLYLAIAKKRYFFSSQYIVIKK